MPTRDDLDWYDMDETLYRASRICRVLGNPTAVKVLAELRLLGAATPTDLAPRIRRTLAATSITLKTLREVDLVRYRREGRNAVYRLKEARVGKILDILSAYVEDARQRRR